MKHESAAGCVCPGSYDPVTFGHLDVIRRAAGLFSRVYVGVLDNAAKRYMFSAADRVQMVRGACSDLPAVEVVRWDGLLVDLLDQLHVDVIVRGMRGSADAAVEAQIAAVNRKLRRGTETLLLPADPVWQSVSSTVVRELIAFGADIAAFVPPSVLRVVSERRVDLG